jgi:hypothetical protein
LGPRDVQRIFKEKLKTRFVDKIKVTSHILQNGQKEAKYFPDLYDLEGVLGFGAFGVVL